MCGILLYDSVALEEQNTTPKSRISILTVTGMTD